MPSFGLIPRLLRSRPLTEGLRYLYRYTRLQAYRHNETLWPFVKVRRDAGGRLAGCELRGVRGPATTPLEQLERSIGGDAHLILSGPSVAQIDYARCRLGAGMGVNGSIALRRQRPSLRFDYYAMLDAGFVRRRRDLVAEALAQDLTLFVTPEAYRWIAFLFDGRAVRCRIALFEEVHQRVLRPRAFPEVLETQLAEDPGLDLTAAAGPRFDKSAASQSPTALDRQFSGHIEPAFRQAGRRLSTRGIKVYNLSPGSRLGGDVFEKRHWSCLLSREADPQTLGDVSP